MLNNKEKPVYIGVLRDIKFKTGTEQ